MSFTDPVDPPEAGAGDFVKAAELLNKVCLLRPTGTGTWPAKETDTKPPGQFIACDVVVIDRAGIVEETTTRIGWWRAMEQLQSVPMREWVLAMPVQQPDNSIILVKTSKPEWREIGAKTVAEISNRAGVAPSEPIYESPDDDSSPF